MRVLNLEEMLNVSGGCGHKSVKKSRCGGKGSSKDSGKGSCKSSGKDSGKKGCTPRPPCNPPVPTPTPTPVQP